MRKIRKFGKLRTSRGIYLLPNIITTGALMAGFYSIILSYSERFVEAAVWVLVAAVLDGVDGRLARLTKSVSTFGAEYDSMSDLISFGVAPSILAFSWGLHNWNENSWLVAFIFAAGTALRLARFNAQLVSPLHRGFFQGMPCPAAAVTLTSFIWTCERFDWSNPIVRWLLFGLCTLLAIAMVSNIRFHSFKEYRSDRIPFVALFGAVIALMLIASYPSAMLLSLGLLYLCSGPLLTLVRLRNKRLERRLRLHT